MSRKQQHPPLPKRTTNRVFQSAFAVLAVISACAVGWYLSGAGIRIETAAVTPSVFDRGLVAKPTATSQSSILANHNRTSLQALSSRTLPSNFSTLCYVTPWNPSGAAAVRSHPHLFTHVSPVWHSVRFRDAPAGSPHGPVEAYLDGDNDVDVEWLSAITGKDIAASISWHDHAPRSAAPVFTSRAHAPLVVPRVLIEPSDARAISLLTSVSLQKQVVSLLQNLVRRYSYDGLVLEATFFWAVAGEYPDHPQHAYGAVAASPAALLLHQGQDKQSPPSVGSLGLTPADMASPRHNLNSFVTSLSSSLRAMEGPQRRILGLAVRPSPPTRIDARASDNASSKHSSEMQQAGARRGVFSSPLGAKHQQQHQRQHAQVFAAVDAVVVGDAVDFYSLMTYDYAPSSLADPFVESNLKSLREQGMQGDQLERSLRVYGWPASPLPWFTGAIAALSEADPASASTAAGANSEQRSVRSRILAGLNLYGMRHGHKSQPEPVLGRDFVSILAENNATAMAARVGAVTVLGADGKALGTGLAAEKAVRGRMFAHHSGEHYFQRPLYSTEAGGRLRLSGEKETVWYPSLHSLWSRMEAAQAAGAGGVSAWECGQGLEYFFELF